MCRLTAGLVCCGWLLVPDTVFAYVGPGAGLSLLGALWALILAVGTAIVFVVAWPIRRMRRRRREARERAANDPQGEKLREKERQAESQADDAALAGAVAPEPSMVPPAAEKPAKAKRPERQ